MEDSALLPTRMCASLQWSGNGQTASKHGTWPEGAHLLWIISISFSHSALRCTFLWDHVLNLRQCNGWKRPAKLLVVDMLQSLTNWCCCWALLLTIPSCCFLEGSALQDYTAHARACYSLCCECIPIWLSGHDSGVCCAQQARQAVMVTDLFCCSNSDL